MRQRRERLETAAVWLALLVLFLAGALVCITSPATEPVKVSRDYYIYHVVGGMENDVGHLIGREVNR